MVMIQLDFRGNNEPVKHDSIPQSTDSGTPLSIVLYNHLYDIIWYDQSLRWLQSVMFDKKVDLCQ